MQNQSDQLKMFPTDPSMEEELIYLQQDFHVRLSQLVGNDMASLTQEVHYFLKSKGFCKITLTMENPYPVYYSKMLKVYLTTMMEKHLLQSMEFCPTSIITLNVNWLILNGGYPNHVKESISLEDIMETHVEEKYYLSTTVQKRLLSYKDNTLIPLQQDTMQEQQDRMLLKVNSMHKSSDRSE